MKWMLWLAILLTALMSAGVGSASEISNASLHKLLELSGVNRQVQRRAARLRTRWAKWEQEIQRMVQAARKKPAPSAKQFSELKHVTVNAFKATDMLRAIRKQLKRNISEQDAHALLAWFTSPVGKRIRKAEDNAPAPDAYQRIVASEQQLLADKPRVRFAKDREKLLRLFDMEMRIDESDAAAKFTLFVSWLSFGESRSRMDRVLKSMTSGMSAQINRLRPRLEHMMIVSSVYTYRHISIANLKRYLAFLKTPAALRFNKSVIIGLEASARQGTATLTKAILASCPPTYGHTHKPDARSRNTRSR